MLNETFSSGVDKEKIGNPRVSIVNDGIICDAPNTLRPEGNSFETKQSGKTETGNKEKIEAKI